MNNNLLFELIISAALNVQKLMPGYTPWRGHLKNDDRSKSRFDIVEIANINSLRPHLADMLGAAHFEFKNGNEPESLVIIAHNDARFGVAVTNAIIPDEEYTMTFIHGSLQAVGHGKFSESPTGDITFALTKEKFPFGNYDFVLASMYPGLPDPGYNADGLTEGQTITGAELLERGWTRCVEG